MGSRLAKVNQHVALVGAGASCQVNGVMFTEGKQHLSYHTRATPRRAELPQRLALQGCTAGQIADGLAGHDQGRSRRAEDRRLPAQRQPAARSNARADSIPGLEIEADDVRCTHGSTTGRVDEELIFYARCRGLTRKEAIRVIVSGFFQQVFDRITIDSVREALGLAIGRRVREYA